jgi:hypothetical protein
MWTAWCDQNQLPTFLFPDNLRKSQDCVLNFLADTRHFRGNKESTLRGKTAALANHFKYMGHDDPPKSFITAQFLKGIKKSDSGTPVARKLPVSRRHFLMAKQRLDLHSGWGSALWAALHLGYFFMLRSNNYAAPGGDKAFDPARILLRRDVIFFIGSTATALTHETAPQISKATIFIKSTKTDQRGTGYARTLLRSQDPDLCVVQALINHLTITEGAPEDWPVTAYYAASSPGNNTRAVTTRNHVAELLKATALALGESLDGYGSHSLRIDGATALHSEGVKDSEIMWFGNWSSPTYLIYCRASTKLTNNFARAMALADVTVHLDDLDHQALRRARPLYGGSKA